MTSESPADRDNVPLESVTDLVLRARNGDAAAVDELFRRYYPVIRRLAHGRLPDRVRGHGATSDAVQITFMRALRGLKDFEPRWEDAWLVYLRQILFNYIRDESRKAKRLPDFEELDGQTEPPDPQSRPLDDLVLQETIAAYRAGLAQLASPRREAVILRLEQDWSYAQIAERLGLPSEDAARMMVKRAILSLGDMISGSQG